MNFLNAQLRDSPFGYNDEIAYAVLDERMNAGQYVLGHIDNFNFSGGLRIYNNYFHHEFTHILLGFSFLKRGKNPFLFEYGYDGNYMAENLVIEAQDFFSDVYFETLVLDRDRYASKVIEHYSFNNEFTDIKNSIQAVQLMNSVSSLKRVFDARRQLRFDNDEIIQAKDVPDLLAKFKTTPLKSHLYLGANLPRDIAENFFDDIEPIIRLVERNYRRLLKDKKFDIKNDRDALRDYLKTVPTSTIWDVMNNPELAETIDIKHQETVTWEFVLSHDKDFDFFREVAGIANVRNVIGAEDLAKPFDYNDYRLFKDNIDSVRQSLDIIGNGRLIHVQKQDEKYSYFIEKAIATNHKRSKINTDLAYALFANGALAFFDKLTYLTPLFETRKDTNGSKKKVTTPSP